MCNTRFHPWVTFFPYTNDLSDNIVSTLKLFVDDTSMFSAVNDANISAEELNKNLQKNGKCHSLLTTKLTTILTRKLNKSSHPKIFFNNAPVFCANWQRHLGMYLYKFLNFSYHIKEKMSKATRGIGITRKLNKHFFNILL